MKIKRKIIEIDENLCNGCGQCVPSCAEGALEIVDGKARMIAEKYCDGLGACLGDCPTGALRIIERVADDFDEEAVEELLAQKGRPSHKPAAPPAGGGCPSSRLQSFAAPTPCQAANQPASFGSQATASALGHWPVKIRLVPPSAPFLKNADLLVAADCASVAFAGFHPELLAGRVVMAGCPKFDETESYIEKFAEILATANLKSLTNVIMEVPCCGAMRNILRQAMQRSGKAMEIDEVVISTRGEILHRGKMAA